MSRKLGLGVKDFALKGTYNSKQIKQSCDKAGGVSYNDTKNGTYGCATGVGVVDCKGGKCTGDCKSCKSRVRPQLPGNDIRAVLRSAVAYR